MATRIENAAIVTPQSVLTGSLVASKGIIEDIFDRAGGGVDFGGDYLIPGLVDLHTDNLERHYFPRPNIDWDPGSAAIIHDGLCVSVGVTTAFDSMSVGSWSGNEARQAENIQRLVNGLQSADEKGMLRTDHRIHWRCETTNPFLQDLVEQLAPHPKTSLLSVMDHTPGQRQYRNLKKHFQH